MTDTKLELVPPTRPLARPRGPLMTPAQIVAEFFMNGETALVSERWVRANVSKKIRLSHSKVLWYRDDVVEFIASRQKPR